MIYEIRGVKVEALGLNVLVLFFCRFKFDDERVTKEELKRALEEQYGGEEEVFTVQ